MPEPEQTNQTPETAAPKLLTRQELAAVMGVEPGTVTRWERDGMPVAKRAPRGQPSMFDPAAVQQWRDDIAAVKMLAQSGLSLEAERARLTRAQAERAERDNLIRAGKLLPFDEVARAGQSYVAAWKTKVTGIPRRMAQAGVITREQEPAVAEICREILIEIASWKTLADVERVAPKSKPRAKKKKRSKKPSAPPAPTTPPTTEATPAP